MAAKKSTSTNMGYAIKPNLPPYPPCRPYPPGPGPIPPGLTVQDWMMYINSYIDVRARQLYDKLKELYSKHDEANVRDYILLKGKDDGKTYKVYMENGILHTETEEEPVPGPDDDPREIEIDEVEFDELNVKNLNLHGNPIQDYFCHFDDLTQDSSAQH